MFTISALVLAAHIHRLNQPPRTATDPLERPAVALALAGVTPTTAAAAGLSASECAVMLSRLTELLPERQSWQQEVRGASGEGGGANQPPPRTARADQPPSADRLLRDGIQNAIRETLGPERRARLEQAQVATRHGITGVLAAVPTTRASATELAKALRREARAQRLGQQVPEGVATVLATARASARATEAAVSITATSDLAAACAR